MRAYGSELRVAGIRLNVEGLFLRCMVEDFPRKIADLLLLFFIPLGLEKSAATSLRALNTSPPRTFFSSLRFNFS